EVVIIKADVSKQEDVQKLFQKITVSLPVMRGIVHAAGVLDDGLLSQLNWPRFARVMAPKIAGTWNLHCFTKDLPLDFFVCFSSISSLIGSLGQGNYAAANAFMDALAHYRRSLGLPGLSINWGPWSGVGMAANLDNRFSAQGINPIRIEQGLQIFGELIRENIAQIGVLSVDWPQFIASYPFNLPLLTQIAQDVRGYDGLSGTQSPILSEWQESSGDSRILLLLAYIQGLVAKSIGTDADQIHLDQPLKTIGFDSLMTVEMKTKLSVDLGVDIPLTKFVEDVTVTTLAIFVNEQLIEKVSISPDPVINQVDEELLAQLNQLTTQEIEVLLSSV
ncbi:MAG: beta-ketoacyl reductase, partial [Microcystis panniformis]